MSEAIAEATNAVKQNGGDAKSKSDLQTALKAGEESGGKIGEQIEDMEFDDVAASVTSVLTAVANACKSFEAAGSSDGTATAGKLRARAAQIGENAKKLVDAGACGELRFCSLFAPFFATHCMC